ncbi:MAG: hypothetical protein IPM07_30630 [Anaerolineales bacterium]|nr:hypothetical protein [Anaerolineales bacterium]
MTGVPCKLSMPNQVGFAVTSVDATLAHYQNAFAHRNRAACGIGMSVALISTTASSRCLLKIGVIALEGIDLEFNIEVIIDGEHPAKDHLQSHREGVNYLGSLSTMSPQFSGTSRRRFW